MQFQNMDLVWSGLAAIGSLLLAGEVKTKAAKTGVWLIFVSFLIQAFWNVYNTWGLLSLIAGLVLVIVALLLGFRKMIFKKR